MVETVAQCVVMPALGFVFLCAFVRIVRGPALPDRVVAIDMLSSVAIGIIATTAILSTDPLILDIALVLALLSFLGTVAFGYYLERYR